ncbi:hypothetical protein [Nitrososphaera sp.]|uniref:hypothetical protein n=1 Tax=Nitrososphaera sp. TaxID=1971748 RepID=UPI00307D72D9
MGILNKKEEKEERQKAAERFYALLKALMDELFDHAQKSRHVKMPRNVSFGLVYDQRDAVLLTGVEKDTGKKMYLYNVRIIGKTFEDKRQQMIEDNTTATLFSWIADVCSIYISPFVYEYVVNVQHRGEGTAERTTRQIVRSFLDRLANDPELKHVLDPLREPSSNSTTTTTTTTTTDQK